MKIIVGAGKMAQAIKNPEDIVLSHKDIEITDDPATLAKTLRKAYEGSPGWLGDFMLGRKPVVVNTAARINLEWCEENKEKCWSVNALGPLNVAKACDILGYRFAQVSSGCVFDGMETGRVYTEDDEPTPASFYAASKAAADDLIAAANLEVPVLTLRPRQIVSSTPNPTNMLTKFMNVGKGPKFITVQNSLTSMEDFARMLDHLIKVGATGVYNCASHGTMSPYEIALKLKDIHPGFDPQPAEYADYLKSVKVKRVNTVLDVRKLQESGYVTLSAWEAVDTCIRNYGKQR